MLTAVLSYLSDQVSELPWRDRESDLEAAVFRPEAAPSAALAAAFYCLSVQMLALPCRVRDAVCLEADRVALPLVPVSESEFLCQAPGISGRLGEALAVLVLSQALVAELPREAPIAYVQVVEFWGAAEVFHYRSAAAPASVLAASSHCGAPGEATGEVSA